MIAVRTSLTANDLRREVAAEGVRRRSSATCRWASDSTTTRDARTRCARSRFKHEPRRASWTSIPRIAEAHRQATRRLGAASSARSAAATTSSRCASTRRTRVWVMLHSGIRGIGNAHRHATSSSSRAATWSATTRTCPTATSPTSRRHAALRRLRRGGRLGAGLRAREPRGDDGRSCSPRCAGTCRRSRSTGEAVNCHHNYVERETHFGEDVLGHAQGRDPRAARASSASSRAAWARAAYIVRGKGSAESFDSCAHGAGRRMSRTARAEAFTAADLAKQTAGRRLPQGQRRGRRDPGRLQGHRRGDGEPARPGRGRAHARSRCSA